LSQLSRRGFGVLACASKSEAFDTEEGSALTQPASVAAAQQANADLQIVPKLNQVTHTLYKAKTLLIKF